MKPGNRQVVIVSGGSRGLGQAIVADFLAQGCTVATFSRSLTPFIRRLQTRDPRGRRFLWEAVDATDDGQLKKFVLAVARRFGRVDVLVNNAGVAAEGVLALMRPEEVRRLIALNLEAAILLTQACARVMLARERGAIISISSITALRGVRGVSVYSATKAALDGLTRSLARELGPNGIRVNAVAPGYFESEMIGSLTDVQRREIARRTPLRRLATPAEIVDVVRFLASPEARFVTGQTLVVDGGFTC
jgi:3-oxoacyl-[acyl-carrier protein] reductase